MSVLQFTPATLTLVGRSHPMTPFADISSYADHLRTLGRPRSTIYLRTWQLRRFAEQHPGKIRAATTADLAARMALSGAAGKFTWDWWIGGSASAGEWRITFVTYINSGEWSPATRYSSLRRTVPAHDRPRR